jgi:chitodextrinase
VNSVEDADGATTVQDWTQNITADQADGLTSGTTYWFQVIVRDEAGNMSIYTELSATTP